MRSEGAVGERCFHCGLSVSPATRCEATIEGRSSVFCCAGCRTVCEVIHETGLDGFYRRLERCDTTLSPPPEVRADSEQYTLPEVQDEISRRLEDGSREARLMVEGIHCAACVWLIEKALERLDGVVRAEVNMVQHRLSLRWRPDEIGLDVVLDRLAALGYPAVPFDEEKVEGAVRAEHRRRLFGMAFAGFGAMNIMWVSIALYAGGFSGISPEYREYFHWVGWAIATPVLVYSGGPILTSAWRGLSQGRLGMDLPIAIGLIVGYAFSVWQTLSGGDQVYFETVVSFLFVILVGRYLESMALRRAASESMRLLELQPRLAIRVGAGDEDETVSVRRLRVGDRLRVRPGDRIAADGRVVEGSSHVDESMLSGEPMPVAKRPGSPLVAGTINGEGALVMRVERAGASTMLSRIIHLVESAQASRAPVQRVVDRVVPWFVGVTLLLALSTFLFWWERTDLATALLAATAVLIVTCPCALGLSTPMAVALGAGVAAERGVLIRHGEALERLSMVDHVVLDKTGTLSQGRMTVTGIDGADAEDARTLIGLAAALERHSAHPIARAVCRWARDEGLSPPEAGEVEEIAGQGILGEIDGCRVAVGSRCLMRAQGIGLPESVATCCDAIEASMAVPVVVARDGAVLGVLRIEDRLRDDAPELVGRLLSRGLRVSVLSGDAPAAAARFGERLSLEAGRAVEVVGGLLPDDKAEWIAGLQAEGATVMMVGDGVNDAPALARADVGIAMGSGTDVAVECAGIVLVGGDLGRIPWAIDLGAHTLRTIRRNLKLSIAYNALLVPAAMAGFVTPVFAALAMPISSLVVIGNAMRIRRCLHERPAVAGGHADVVRVLDEEKAGPVLP